MTKKEIYREAIFVSTSYIVSTIILSILTVPKKAYLNDIFVSVQDAPHNWYDFIFNINFTYGLLFFFPTLFIVNTFRQVYYKMQLRYLNIFQLFVTFVSILVTIVLVTLLRQFSDAMDGVYTIYPPLSAAPEVNSNAVYAKQWTYCILGFCLLQLIVFVWTIIKIFRTAERH
jgi:hypothetical protein